MTLYLHLSHTDIDGRQSFHVCTKRGEYIGNISDHVSGIHRDGGNWVYSFDYLNPLVTPGTGKADSLEEAKTMFRQTWTRYLERLGVEEDDWRYRYPGEHRPGRGLGCPRCKEIGRKNGFEVSDGPAWE